MTSHFAVSGAGSLEPVLVGILAGVSVLFLLAYVTRVPYPIWLTVGGAALAFVPGVPDVELAPELVLLIFLPPLLSAAAYGSSARDLRFNLRPITLLAVGLVLATTFGVAAVARLAIPGLSWEVAIVLGAVLGPTDPVAATAIAGRVGAPQRLVTVLEGESLVNDATALIAYRFAVAAVTTGGFSLIDAASDFVLGVLGGALVGVAVTAALGEAFRRIDDAPTEGVLTLVLPFFAYLPADLIGVSGVIAAVASGLYMGRKAPVWMSAQTRLQLTGVWEVLVFVLNSALFVLVGLQLPTIVDSIAEESPLALAGYALVVALAVMAIRLAWVFPSTYLPRRLSRRIRERDPAPPWRITFLVGFTGMRGAVSLAAALAIPETLPGGEPFPARELVIFLTFTTILWTVVVEGLSLPWLLRVLDVHDEGTTEREEDKARVLVAEAALRRMDELQHEGWVREDTAERMRGLHAFRRRRFLRRLGHPEGEEDGVEDADERSRDYQRLVRELLDAQRATLLDLRREGRIGDEAMRRVERDLDLEETRLDVGRSAT